VRLAVGLGVVGSVVVGLDRLWFLGVLVLLAAWWLLRTAAPRVLYWATALWSLPLLVLPPLFSRDAYAYAAQAHLVLEGLDPYTSGPSDAAGPLSAEVDAVWRDAPSPYGPVFLWLAARVVQVTGERPLAAAYGMRLLAVVGVVLIAWALPRLAVRHGVPGGRALWLGLANPLVLLHGIGGAHNDVLMVGLLVAGLAVSSRVMVAAGLITLGALVKLPAVAGLAFLPLLAERRVRAAVAVAGTAAVVSVVVAAATGLGWGWVSTLDAGQARRSLLSPTTGVGVLVGAVNGLHVVGVVVALLVSAALLLRAAAVGPVRALGLALLTVVLLGPVVQPWYLLWAVVPLAAVVSARWAAGLGAACALVCLLVLPSGRHVIRPPLYGLPMLLAAAVGLAAVRLESSGMVDPTRPTRTVPHTD
jgi:alpha-1,6-mannosyltransferase